MVIALSTLRIEQAHAACLKMEIQFFSVENNSMSTSFGKKFVTV